MAIAVSVSAAWMLSPRGAESRRTDLVDGSQDPTRIPDRIAYSLMLRLISGAKDEKEKRYIRSYITRMGIQDAEDLRILSATADNFKQKIEELDAKVTAIKKPENEGGAQRVPHAQQQLRQLRSQFDTAVEEAIASLSRDMSKPGLAQLKQFMDLEFKTKVKLRTEGTL